MTCTFFGHSRLPVNVKPVLRTIIADMIEKEGVSTLICDYRNLWMLERSEYVVTYVRYSFGGAAKYAEIARKKHKTVINIADMI